MTTAEKCVVGFFQPIVALIQNLSTMRDLKQAQALITKTGLTAHSLILAKLLTFSALSPSGSLQYATAIFNNSPVTNSFHFNTMIRAYSHSVSPIKAIHLYNQMHFSDVRTDSFTYPFVLRACTRAAHCVVFDQEEIFGKKGAEIHGEIVQLGHLCDGFVQNSLVRMYSQCGSLENARSLFDEMSERTVASWNVMIAGYDQAGEFELANSLFARMLERNVVSWNARIARFVKLGDVKGGRNAFDEMPQRDGVSWNSMIAGYIQVKDYKEALVLFREMWSAGVEVTEITLVSVLGLCAETGELVIGKEIHNFLKEKEFEIEGFLGSALVDMYAKCGSLNSALEVFNEMKVKHVSCWNAIIMALAVHGKSEEALELFSIMEEKYDEAVPNRITFIAVLIACSHKGLVEEGRQFFRRMVNEYKIKPDMKHFGCIVDLLCRWGLLGEARQVVQTMPFEANSVLWRTLLGACRVYRNVELAEEAFKKISMLETPQDGDCVLLSNIYAEMGRWVDVERLRNEMIELEVLKRPGSSFIEVR
ncbi:hypothetical protein Scep_002291 [Stephania cephalantha]|uniref:Pentatricopeptide repeat-containing protein n=1 Tax=Stephania cephalantha TaxID=152367 RepID=A0AAP0LCF4_9MAGN